GTGADDANNTSASRNRQSWRTGWVRAKAQRHVGISEQVSTPLRPDLRGQRPKGLSEDQMRNTPKRTRGGGSTTLTRRAWSTPNLDGRYTSCRTTTAISGKTGVVTAECDFVSTDCNV